MTAIPETRPLIGTDDVMTPAETVAFLLCSEVDRNTPIASFQRCVRVWMSSNNATGKAAVEHFAPRYAECFRLHNGNEWKSLDAFLAPYRVN